MLVSENSYNMLCSTPVALLCNVHFQRPTIHTLYVYSLQVDAAPSWHTENATTLIPVQQGRSTIAIKEKPLLAAKHAARVLSWEAPVLISADSAFETLFCLNCFVRPVHLPILVKAVKAV